MAQLNIKDSWWLDPRRSHLIKSLNGDEERADGAAVRLWRVAQIYWQNKHEAIPKSCFEMLPCASELLSANLVRLDGDKAWCRGADDAFDWMDTKKRAGQKGGKKSAKTRKERYGTAQPSPKKSIDSLEAHRSTPKHTEPYIYSSSKSLDASVFASASDPFLSSAFLVPESFKEENQEPPSEGESLAALDPRQMDLVTIGETKELTKKQQLKKLEDDQLQRSFSGFVGAYRKAFKSKFSDKAKLDISPKLVGQIKAYLKGRELERCINLIEVYFQMDDKWFVTKSYDWVTFESNQSKIGVALDTGNLPGVSDHSEFLANGATT